MWGHGYVQRLFDGFEQPLWIKRYRCPDCRTWLHTARPDSHWRGFLAPWKVILVCLMRKLKKCRWLKGPSRQRQQYWWKGFLKQLGREGSPEDCTMEALRRLVQRPIILSTHSLEYYEISSFEDIPHLRFAATPAAGFG